MRHILIALLSAMALAAGIATATAAPVTAPAPPIAAATTGNALVVPVHYNHRDCVYGRIHRWGIRARHRHRGHRVYVCERRWRRDRHRHYPRDWRRRGCFKIGPIWYCP